MFMLSYGAWPSLTALVNLCDGDFALPSLEFLPDVLSVSSE
jgi:hypothetical protein